MKYARNKIFFLPLQPQKNNYDMKRILLSIASIVLCLSITAQPQYDYSTLHTEQLDRGVVAVRQSDGKVFVSWRILRDDAKGEAMKYQLEMNRLNEANEKLTKRNIWHRIFNF